MTSLTNMIKTKDNAARIEQDLAPQLEKLAEYASRLPANPSTSQWAYDAILGAMLNRILPSGQRLAEIPVARSIGVGRTPVREALMRLEADGFVTSEPRIGMVVARDTLESLAETYEVREVLESFASRLAARYARPVDVMAIRQIVEDSIEPTRECNVERLRLLNTAFHEAIHLAAHNDQLRRVLRQLINRVRLSPISLYSVEGRPESALREHQEILEAIVARREDLAAHLAGEHQRRDKEIRLALMARSTLLG